MCKQSFACRRKNINLVGCQVGENLAVGGDLWLRLHRVTKQDLARDQRREFTQSGESRQNQSCYYYCRNEKNPKATPCLKIHF